ncbi:MAG: CehA/McbA family metallohydrolase [Syntrophomonadaceae bacterium]|nr:CehA/McbA family metallohydrolase [Syntrophomonadaceae bacterium]
MYEYKGNIHVHSSYSDGSGTIWEIAQAAAKAGLDFVVVTDHHQLTALARGEEGYYGKTLVMVGMEINRERNHYLGLDIDKVAEGDDEDPQKVIDAVNRQGGLGFIVHPYELGSKLFENGRTYPWTDWDVRGYAGIGIWNHLSQWRDGLTSILKALYLTYINPHQPAKYGPECETLAKWDQLLQERLVVGIGCSDAHAIIIKLGPLKAVISDYYTSFRCVNTHVLLEQPLGGKAEPDQDMIYKALRTGRYFFSYDFFRDPAGFRFFGKSCDKTAQMGENIEAAGAVLIVENPGGRVYLIRNGRRCRESDRRKCCFRDLTPGVYRVEAFHRHGWHYRAWIYSNPIFLK